MAIVASRSARRRSFAQRTTTLASRSGTSGPIPRAIMPPICVFLNVLRLNVREIVPRNAPVALIHRRTVGLRLHPLYIVHSSWPSVQECFAPSRGSDLVPSFAESGTVFGLSWTRHRLPSFGGWIGAQSPHRPGSSGRSMRRGRCRVALKTINRAFQALPASARAGVRPGIDVHR